MFQIDLCLNINGSISTCRNHYKIRTLKTNINLRYRYLNLHIFFYYSHSGKVLGTITA